MPSNVMTTREVAEYLGFSNPNSVSSWASRYGVAPIYRQPGRKGVNVYARTAVMEGKKRMPGQGMGGGRPRSSRK
jgi:hypothetical protein